VEQSGKRVLTTQLYVRGEKLKDQDFLFRREKDPKALETLLVDFNPLKGSKPGELHAKFNIVLGITPDERQAG